MEQRIRVQCYAGYKADERPLSFDVGDRSFKVTGIIDRWYDVDSNYFKVEVEEEKGIFLLRHDLNNDAWELVQTRDEPE